MKKVLSPTITIGLSVALLALFLQWFGISYLNNLSSAQLKSDTDQLKIQITQDIAAQLARALAIQDDLGALAAIKTTRSIHPQLHSLIIFDNQGRISLHTDPGMMGKKVPAPKGPRLIKPSLKHITNNDRQMTVILVPLPENDDFYCRAFFDNHKAIQSGNSYSMRFYLIITLIAVTLGLVIIFCLNRFDLIDPKTKIQLITNHINPPAAIQTLAQLAVNQSTLMIVDNQNKILAVNDSLINTTGNVIGNHIMRSGLSKNLINAISQLTKNPEDTLFVKLNASKSAALCCIPAGQNWHYIVVRQ